MSLLIECCFFFVLLMRLTLFSYREESASHVGFDKHPDIKLTALRKLLKIKEIPQQKLKLI